MLQRAVPAGRAGSSTAPHRRSLAPSPGEPVRRSPRASRAALAAALLALLLSVPASAARVAGRVIGYPDGEPLPGVQILAMDPQGGAVEVTSQQDGTFTAEGVQAGLVRVRARPDQGTNRIGAYWGDTWGFCPARTAQLGPEDSLDDVLIELPEGGSVEGEVCDEDGAPLTSVAVSATGLDVFDAGVVRTGSSEGDGAFRIVGLDSVIAAEEAIPGHYQLSFRDAGSGTWFYPGVWDVALAEAVESFRRETTALPPVARPAPASVAGRVVDGQGLGVGGAAVELYAAQGGSLQVATSQQDGSFGFQQVWGTDLSLTVSAEGFADAGLPPFRPAAPGEAMGLDPITLLPEAVLWGSVHGADPEAGFQILLLGPDGRESARASLPAAAESWEMARLPAGTFRIEVRPAAASDRIGYEVDGVVLVSGEELRLDLSIEQGATLAGTVRRRGGLPLRGAVVAASDPDSGADLPRGLATTDGDGRFLIRGLRPGTALLRASWQPFCPSDPTLVPAWAADGRTESEAEPLDLRAGEGTEAGELLLPPDRDGDAMDDVWELAWGLDCGVADGGADPDGDGLTNLQEYRGRSDPLVADGGGGGCGGGGAALLVLPLLVVSLAPLTRRKPGASMRDPLGDPRQGGKVHVPQEVQEG